MADSFSSRDSSLPPDQGLRWMWADSGLLNISFFHKLAELNVKRWSDLVSKEAMIEDLEVQSDILRPVRIGWRKSAEEDSSWHDERFANTQEAIEFLSSNLAREAQAGRKQELQQAWDRLRHFPEEKVEQALKDCGNDPHLACRQLLLEQPQAPDLRDDPEGWFSHFDLRRRNALNVYEVADGLELTFGDKDVLQECIQIWKDHGFADDDEIGPTDFVHSQLREAILQRWAPERRSKEEEDVTESEPEVQGEDAADAALRRARKPLSPGGVLGVFFFADVDLPDEIDCASRLASHFKSRENNRENDLNFAVLPVSADGSRRLEDLQPEMANMPHWRDPVAFDQKVLRRALMKRLKVTSFPKLVLIGPHGTLKHLEVDEETMREMHREVEQLAEAPAAPGSPSSSSRPPVISDPLHGQRDVSEEGYKAASASFDDLRAFACRVVAIKRWEIKDKKALLALLHEHEGDHVQSLKAFISDLDNLRSATAVASAKMGEVFHSGERAGLNLTPQRAHDLGYGGGMVRVKQCRGDMASPAATASDTAADAGMESMPQDAVEAVQPSMLLSEDTVVDGDTYVREVEVGQGQSEAAQQSELREPDAGAQPSESVAGSPDEKKAGEPGNPAASPNKGKGKGKGKAPPNPAPAQDGQGAQPSESVAGSPDEKKAGEPGNPAASPNKGKGKGKGKAPPNPAPAQDGQGQGAAPAAPKPKAKGGGKGPPPPTPPPKGAGKGKGAAGAPGQPAGAAAAPDWLKGRKTRKMFWKRVGDAQLNGSIFQEDFLAPVSDELTEKIRAFTLDDTTNAASPAKVAEQEKKAKAPLWEEERLAVELVNVTNNQLANYGFARGTLASVVGNQDGRLKICVGNVDKTKDQKLKINMDSVNCRVVIVEEKDVKILDDKARISDRRKSLAIVAKLLQKDDFLQHLEKLDLEALQKRAEDDQNKFEQLVKTVISFTDTEQQRLKHEGSEEFEWDPTIEGFFYQLVAKPFATERLIALQEYFRMVNELQKLADKIQSLSEAAEAVLSCEALKKIMCRIREIGNVANTGAGLASASGFDVVEFLEKDLHNAYKKDGKTLLMFLQELCLGDEDKEQCRQLAASLKKGPYPNSLQELKTGSELVYEQYKNLCSSLGQAQSRRLQAQDQEVKAEEEVQQRLQEELKNLRRYDDILRDFRGKYDNMEAEREVVTEKMQRLLRHLLAQKHLAGEARPGHILDLICVFAESVSPKRPRSKTESKAAKQPGSWSNAARRSSV